jgi:hypothetical protein
MLILKASTLFLNICHIKCIKSCTIALQAVSKAPGYAHHQFAPTMEWIPVPFYRLSAANEDIFLWHE